MVKEYKLEVLPLYEFEGDYRPIEYYSKGHHDKEGFLTEVEAQYDPFDGEIIEDVDHYVRHEYWRMVPTVDPYSTNGNEYVSLMTPTKKGAGAFPVTVIDV